MIKYIKLILLFIWQLPQNLIAILMLPFIGKMKLIQKENFAYVFECSKMQGGISLGNFIFISPSLSKKKNSILHELGHTKQSHLLGVFYLFVIGIPSILNATFKFTKCYYSWYTESWANKLVGLGVDTKCRLYLYDKPNYNKNK